MIVDGEGTAWLADFGLARVVSANDNNTVVESCTAIVSIPLFNAADNGQLMLFSSGIKWLKVTRSQLNRVAQYPLMEFL